MAGPVPTYSATQTAAQTAFTVPFGLITMVNNAITTATAAGLFNATVDCSLFTVQDVLNLRIYLDSLGYDGQLARDTTDKSLNITWSQFLDIPNTEVTVDQGTTPWIVSGTVTTSPNVNIHDGTGNSIGSVGSSLNVDVTNFPATQNVAVATALPSGTNVLGHVITDSGSTTGITGNVAVIQATGANLHTVVDSGTITLSGTSPVSGTVTSNQGTPNIPANSWPVEVTDGTNTLGTTTHPFKVDPTGTTTQPVSASSLPLPTGAATSTNQTNASQKTQIVDGSGNVIAATSNALNVDVTNFPATQPISGTVAATQGTSPWVISGAVTEANVDKNFGTWAYYAGTSGTVTVSGGQRVIGITAFSLAGGSMTVNSGATITIPAGISFSLEPLGNITAPTIVFTGTTAYFVEVVS